MAKLNLFLAKSRLRDFLDKRWKPDTERQQSDYSISLTSWSKRLDYLQLTLVAIINQNVRPAGVHVWLTEHDLDLIPRLNRNLFEAQGVRFETSPDYRSHKKWLPLLLGGHRGPFVICDDDIFYPREWFGRLISEDKKDSYVGCKCHRLRLGPERLPLPYSQWEKQIYHQAKPSHALFATGCGGAIIHPERLPEKALDWAAIKKNALFADDIWLHASHLANGFPVFKTKYCFPCLELPGTDDSGLFANHNTAQNDEQVQAVWDFFKIKDIR